MEKYDKFFRDKCPCSRTNMQIFGKDSVEEGLPRTIFASVNYLITYQVHLSRKTCHLFHLHYQAGKLVKENLLVCTLTVDNSSLIRRLFKENEALVKVPRDTDLLTLLEIGHGVH